MIETRTCTYGLHFHLIFATKYRKPIFDNAEKQSQLKGGQPLRLWKSCQIMSI